MVGALRQPDLACREGCRTAAGRAATGQRRVPGIGRAAEHLVEGRAAGAELGRVRLGDDDAALALDALDDGMRSFRDIILEDARAIRGAHACHIGQVLDGDGDAAEPAGLAVGVASLAAHEALGMLAGAIETQGRERIERGLAGGDPLRRGLHQVERGDLLPRETGCHFAGGHAHQLVGHRRLRNRARISRGSCPRRAPGPYGRFRRGRDWRDRCRECAARSRRTTAPRAPA